MTKEEYDAYLASDAWQRKAEMLKKGYDYKCQDCMAWRPGGSGLHVHHLNYNNVGDEKISDLRVLCSVCHAKYHPSKTRNGNLFYKWKNLPEVNHIRFWNGYVKRIEGNKNVFYTVAMDMGKREFNIIRIPTEVIRYLAPWSKMANMEPGGDNAPVFEVTREAIKGNHSWYTKYDTKPLSFGKYRSLTETEKRDGNEWVHELEILRGVQ